MGPSSAKVAFALATTGLSECKIMIARTSMNTVTLTARRIQNNDHKERFMAETPYLREDRDRVASGRVMGEDKVAIFDERVAGIAALEHRLAGGFAVVKLSEPPAAGRGVFFESLTIN